ncbi:MAG: hypothetical protein QOK10_481 [Pseudonocardiales bacterium]|nr:hypothetical protein [Pseudonocardiales bacterium]
MPASPASDEVPPDARHLTIPARRLTKWLDGFANRHGAISTEVGATRVLVIGADGSRAWIEIPFPPLDLSAGRVLTTLAAHADRARRVGVLLVRRGGYAAGVFQGSQLLSSKVGSGYVQGTTKAGGWSQQRYARRRHNQARAAFAEAADVAARILLPEASAIEQLVTGGDRPAIEAVLADPRLRVLAAVPRGPFLTVGDPRLKVLQATPDQFRVVNLAVHP